MLLLGLHEKKRLANRQCTMLLSKKKHLLLFAALRSITLKSEGRNELFLPDAAGAEI